MITYLSKIEISRPIYFLCGPYINKNSKRIVLHKHLIENFSSCVIRPFPIIVDDIFKSRHIETYKLDIGLLEEIVSAISYRTYIFLDSLSTAYEYGSFQNSKTDNNVVILLEKGFENRKRRAIGTYLRNRFYNSTVLSYPATEKIEGLECFEFENESVPNNIVEHINKEMAQYAANQVSIGFVNSSNNLNDTENNIRFSIDKSTISTSLSLKSLFYYMSYYLNSRYSSIKKIRAKNNSHFKRELVNFKNTIKGQCLSAIGDSLACCSIYNKIRIIVDGYDESKTNEVIRHVYFFFVLLNGFKYKKLYKLTNVQDYVKVKTTHSLDFGPIIDQLRHSTIVDDYINNPDKYVDTVRYKINCKYRIIRKYKDNYKGRQLKHLHEVILNALSSTLPTNDNSFAYKKDLNTLKCVQKHLDSIYFIKTDIHHFFDSIKYRTLMKLVHSQIDLNTQKNRVIFFGKNIPTILSAKYLKTLFYKGKIPLGFVTSPKLSDYYLKDEDDQMSTCKNIIYTRYADDVLLSSRQDTKSINRAFKKLKVLLNKKGLIINEQKTIASSLFEDDAYIKYLGIVVLRKNNNNVIRISNKYIKDVIKTICLKDPSNVLEDDVIIGKLRYIKAISLDSYKTTMNHILKIRGGAEIYNSIKSKIR